MRNLNKDNKRAAELFDLLLDDSTDSATREEIRAWLWSNVSMNAKDSAMAERFRQMAPNMSPDETDHKKYGELALRLNINGPARMPVRKSIYVSVFRTPVRVAASVALLLGIPAIAYMLSDKAGKTAQEPRVAEVTVSSGASVRSVRLPDGSRVELQPDSELTYDENFTSGRLVRLDGEALLTVEGSTNESGETRPFSVTTDDLKLDVYGTVFRVIDHSDDVDDRSIVTLYEGSVGVTAKDTTLMLSQGETYSYDHAAQKSNVGMILAVDMVEHGFTPLLKFEDSPLGNLITSLAANYGVEFVLPGDIDLSKGRFSGDFQAEDLKTTLNILTKSSSKLNFTLADDKVFVKRK